MSRQDNRVLHDWRLYGSQQPSVIAAGHSHVACLLTALTDGVAPVGVAAAVAYSATVTSGPPTGPSYWDFVVDKARGRTLAIMWNGNQHHAGFLVAPDPPMRLYGSKGQATDLGIGTWVPLEMMRAHWEPSFAELPSVLSRTAVQATQLLLLGTPPPKRDALIRANLAEERLFTRLARETGIETEELRLTPEADRLVMWGLLQQMLSECAAQTGVQFVPAPSVCTDADGYLLEKYSAPDATHANTAYGLQLWNVLSRLMNGDVEDE